MSRLGEQPKRLLVALALSRMEAPASEKPPVSEAVKRRQEQEEKAVKRRRKESAAARADTARMRARDGEVRNLSHPRKRVEDPREPPSVWLGKG